MLVFDSNNLCHISKWTVPVEFRLQADEICQRITFGFLFRVMEFWKKLEGDSKIVFAWDSSTLWRKRIDPSYKSNRHDKEDDNLFFNDIARCQFEVIRKDILPRIGFGNVLMRNGYESDDLIAWIVLDEKRVESVTVVSRDHDLYQLLDCCTIYQPVEDQIMTREFFVNRYGIEPVQWELVRSYSGDKSDGIPGMAGVGEITALKYIKGELAPKKKKAIREWVEGEGQRRFQLNLQLIHLPFPNLLPIELKPDDFSLDEFITICDDYNLKHFLKPEILRQWMRLFQMEYSHGNEDAVSAL